MEYRYDWDDGTYSSWDSSTGATKSWGEAGTYAVKAQARCAEDGTVMSDWSSAKSVTINDPAPGDTELPVAAFTFEPSSAVAGDPVTFDASGSFAPAGMIEVYAWEFGDGSVGNGETATHTYASDGAYDVRLTVTDNEGATATTSQTVSVQPAEAPDVSRTILTARISSGGSAVNSPDVVSATQTGVGAYRVQFNQPVSTYALVATSTTSSTSPQMVSTIAGTRLNIAWTDIVVVRVFDADGNPQNGSFHLKVVGPAAGAPRTVLHARVSTAGTPHHSPDVVNAVRTGVGAYRVEFGQPVSTYALLATSTTGPTSSQMITTVAGTRLNTAWTNKVVVRVFDANGNPQDGSFHLTVVGPTAAAPRTVLYARVGSGGTVHNAPDVVSATRTDDGAYRVVFNQSVANYALIATSTTSSTSPQMVTTIAGTRFNTAWTDVVVVRVFDSDGNPQNGSFQLTATGG